MNKNDIASNLVILAMVAFILIALFLCIGVFMGGGM